MKTKKQKASAKKPRRQAFFRFLNDCSVPGVERSSWRTTYTTERPYPTPFSDNVREHFPVLTQEMAGIYLDWAGESVLNPDVEEVAEAYRLSALTEEVRLLRLEQLRRGHRRRLIVPFGLFPRDDASVVKSLDVFLECGACPVGGYIANSVNRQQAGVIHGTTLEEDLARSVVDAERYKYFLPRRSDVKIIVWLHDHYIFPDFDPQEGGGWGTESPLSDEAVARIDEVLFDENRGLFDGYQYWNEQGAPVDARLTKLGPRR